MPWFKVDDSFYDHPKVFDAPDCAVALWTRAGSWSSRNLTNGYVPAAMLARLCQDPETAAGELVRRGLWSRTRGGYRFHDWKDCNPLKNQVLALREARTEAGRLGGLASGETRRQTRSKTEANDVVDNVSSNTHQSRDLRKHPSKTEAKPEAFASTHNEPPTRPDHINGSAGDHPERGLSTATRKPDFSHNNPNPNGTATRQPPPVADAIAAALNPDGRTGRHARQENP